MARILLAHREVMALLPAALYSISVIHGYLWISHDGEDILLQQGDSWAVPAASRERIVIEALRGHVQCLLIGSQAAWQQAAGTITSACRAHGSLASGNGQA